MQDLELLKNKGIQLKIPVFPTDATLISGRVAVKMMGDFVYYINGGMPIFQHHKDDRDSFRFIAVQLYLTGNCKQSEIVRCFEISDVSLKRWVKQAKETNKLSDFVSKKKSGTIKS
jgi:hypothetical protein